MATTGLGRLTIDMIMKTAGFEQGMSRAERRTKQTSRQMAKDMEDASRLIKASLTGIAKMAAGALGVFSVGSLFKVVIDNTIAFTNEQKQLAAALKSTAEVAGFTRMQLNEMADALAGKSLLSTNEINKAQTALVVFTNIIGNEFVRAQQSAADMAARTGMSMTQTAELIGRALDVPSAGMAALSRQGFKFSAEQQKLMKVFEATGQTAAAQGIILDALEETYGGAAVAARDTFGGALTALKNTLGGLLTGGEDSLEGARVAIEKFNTTLSSPEAKAAFGAMVEGIITGLELIVKGLTAIPWEHATEAIIILSGVMLGRMVPSIVASAGAFKVAVAETVRYQTALATMAGVTNAASATSTIAATRMTAVGVATSLAAKAMDTAAVVMNRALAMMGGPWGAAVVAAVALYAALRDTGRGAQEAAETMDKYRGSIDETKQKLLELTEVQRKNELAIAQTNVPKLWEEHQKAVKKLADEIIIYQLNAGKGAAEAREFYKQVREGTVSTSELVAQFEELSLKGQVSPSVMTSIYALASSVDTAKKNATDADGVVAQLRQTIADLGVAGSNAAAGVGELNTQLLAAQAAGAKYLEDITKGNITAGIKTELGRLQALIKAGELAFATPEQEQQALAAAGLRDRLTASTTKLTKSTNDAKKAMESMLDRLLPMEKITKDYEQDQTMLSAALKKGAIDSEQYASAMLRLNQQRDEAVKNLIPQEVKRMEELRNTTAATMQTFIVQQERMLAGMGKGEQWNELASALGQVEDKYRSIAMQMATSGGGISTEDLDVLREYMEMEMAIVEEYHNKKVALNDSYWHGMEQGMQDYIDSVGTASEQVAGVMSGAFTSLENMLTDFVLTGEMNIGDMMRSIGQSVVQMLVKMGVQMLANWAMAQMFGTASMAAATVQGSAMATAYAPAAALASLASFGANAVPATAGILSTMGIAQTAAFAGMFDDGGNIRAGQFGIVGEFGPEIVKGPANVTSREDTMRMLRNGGNEASGDTIIQFYGDPNLVQSVESDTDEFKNKVVRIMLADWQGGGEFSQALTRSSNLQRTPR